MQRKAETGRCFEVAIVDGMHLCALDCMSACTLLNINKTTTSIKIRIIIQKKKCSSFSRDRVTPEEIQEKDLTCVVIVTKKAKWKIREFHDL